MSSEKKNNDYLLEVEHLKQYFPVHQGFSTIPLKAVDDISFAIRPGETLGLVGESGCGKTTVGRTLLRLYQPTAGKITFDGNVLFDSGEQYDENGKMIVDANGKPVMGKKVDVNMMPYRKEMQMVFQDPYSSLNPRMTVEDIIGEPLDVHKLYRNKKERREKILDLIQTSTCSVAVMPEAEDVEVHIDDKDIRIDVMRASGNGGQCVNTTDSAVRLTHYPTGIVIYSQTEKSQIQNKEKAFALLRTKLYDLELQKKQDAESEERRSQIGTGDRSEKIRTYNFPQGRVTDHRINLTLYKLDKILDGDIQEIIDACIAADQAKKLAKMQDEN